MRVEKSSSATMKSGPPSPSPSSRTVSSTNSVFRSNPIKNRRSGSSTSSNSDLEEDFRQLEFDSVPQNSNIINHNSFNEHVSSDGNVFVVQASDSNLANGTKIAVDNSTDIHFGNKLFYNGPVTIKQFMLDRNNQWIGRPNSEILQIENGVNNLGFDVGKTH